MEGYYRGSRAEGFPARLTVLQAVMLEHCSSAGNGQMARSRRQMGNYCNRAAVFRTKGYKNPDSSGTSGLRDGSGGDGLWEVGS